MSISAVSLAPPFLRTAGILPILFALDQGHALLIPARLMSMGTVCERLAAIARRVGAPVIVDESFADITTREPVSA